MSTTEPVIVVYDAARGLHLPDVRLSPVELFEFQRTTLARGGLAPLEIFDRFADCLPSDLFILVPPQPARVDLLDWVDLMGKVTFNGKGGQSDLKSQHLLDYGWEVKVPTMLIGVEDESKNRRIRPMDSRMNIIQREGRQPYALWHGYIVVRLFPQVLTHHSFWCVGTRYMSAYKPHFYLKHGQPTLHCHAQEVMLYRYGEGLGREEVWDIPSYARSQT